MMMMIKSFIGFGSEEKSLVDKITYRRVLMLENMLDDMNVKLKELELKNSAVIVENQEWKKRYAEFEKKFLWPASKGGR